MSTQVLAIAEKMTAGAVAAGDAGFLRALSADFLWHVDHAVDDLSSEDEAGITRLSMVLLDAAARAGDRLAHSIIAGFPAEVAVLREGGFSAPLPPMASC